MNLIMENELMSFILLNTVEHYESQVSELMVNEYMARVYIELALSFVTWDHLMSI